MIILFDSKHFLFFHCITLRNALSHCNRDCSYGLREIDGKRFISDPLPGDKLVTSSADGLWEKR